MENDVVDRKNGLLSYSRVFSYVTNKQLLLRMNVGDYQLC